jgi:bifunctional DNA-binding transcriptional regulator/antitoxin component of YhaV-PrlF toxin-antitoxin module
MKATGIVHRIDDLGRVVIPKEIHSVVGRFVLLDK